MEASDKTLTLTAFRPAEVTATRPRQAAQTIASFAPKESTNFIFPIPILISIPISIPCLSQAAMADSSIWR